MRLWNSLTFFWPCLEKFQSFTMFKLRGLCFNSCQPNGFISIVLQHQCVTEGSYFFLSNLRSCCFLVWIHNVIISDTTAKYQNMRGCWSGRESLLALEVEVSDYLSCTLWRTGPHFQHQVLYNLTESGVFALSREDRVTLQLLG